MGHVYEQSGDYMPRSDDGFWHFLQNFSSLISENPQRFGMTAADAEIIANHFAAYNEVWQKSKQPSLRTSTLIAQKDAVKASAMGSIRVYARIIKGIAGVDEQSRIALGLHVDDTTRTLIGAPTTAPILKMSCAYPGEHIIGYSDETMPNARRKPPGARLIEICRNVAWGPDPVVATAVPVALTGKQPIRIPQEQADAGYSATYFGRWVTERGLKGPWSLPVYMTICFGGPVDMTAAATKPPEGVTMRAPGGAPAIKAAA